MPPPSHHPPDDRPPRPPTPAGAQDAGSAATLGEPPAKGPRKSKAREVGERAVANTLYRSVGEIVGRLASLVLFAAVARRLGENGLGAFVFAMAYLGFVMVAVDLGLDRYMLRVIARAHSAADDVFFNVIALKLALAVPLFTLTLAGLHLVGYDSQAQATALVLAPGVFADSVARTQSSLFAAQERGGPPSLADAIQRICSAALGIGALQAGYGVVGVGAAYSAGSLIGVAIGFALMQRTLGVPTRAISRRGWLALAAGSIPFAAQDTFAVLLARMDTLLLALLATQAAVGRYGAAYRLFESTFFIAYALTGAFSAMYTYLGPDSDPPLRFVFQRSIKLSLVLLTPLAITFAVLADPICRSIYGQTFVSAAQPLRILAPCVVLMGVVILATSLMVSRENPRRMVPVAAAMAAINIAINLVLIPLYGDAGAAGAMLATTVVYAAWIMRMSARIIGPIAWCHTLAGALAAGIGMTCTGLLLKGDLLAALLASTAVYMIALLTVERLVNPLDVAFVVRMVRRRLPSGRVA
ncbi:MAG TPA: flippase [Solirubrobacteraceae bacterium]|nr:flippase [Solirubrobacteraceae bacterium]